MAIQKKKAQAAEAGRGYVLVSSKRAQEKPFVLSVAVLDKTAQCDEARMPGMVRIKGSQMRKMRKPSSALAALEKANHSRRSREAKISLSEAAFVPQKYPGALLASQPKKVRQLRHSLEVVEPSMVAPMVHADLARDHVAEDRGLVAGPPSTPVTMESFEVW